MVLTVVADALMQRQQASDLRQWVRVLLNAYGRSLVSRRLTGVMAEHLKEIRHRSAGSEKRRDVLGAGTWSVVNHQGINTFRPKPSGTQVDRAQERLSRET